MYMHAPGSQGQPQWLQQWPGLGLHPAALDTWEFYAQSFPFEPNDIIGGQCLVQHLLLFQCLCLQKFLTWWFWWTSQGCSLACVLVRDTPTSTSQSGSLNLSWVG